jgi:hypothetical protein
MSFAEVIEIVCALLVLAVVFTAAGMRLAFWLLRRGNYRNGG